MKNKTTALLDTLSREELSAITDRIKYLRSDILQMTQSQFSVTAKISQSYLSLLENGDRELNMSALQNIASSFRINLDWLIYGIGGDENIFASGDITREYLMHSRQASVLKDLQKIYSLKTNELDFIDWYLSLPAKDRQHFIESIKTISTLFH